MDSTGPVFVTSWNVSLDGDFYFFDALCHGFSPGLIRSELCCASLLSAYHKLKDVVFWLALIVFAIHSYSLQGTDCLTN